MKKFFQEFLVVSAITFIVAAVVSFLYSLIVHGSGVFDWTHAIRLALILGLALPMIDKYGKK